MSFKVDADKYVNLRASLFTKLTQAGAIWGGKPLRHDVYDAYLAAVAAGMSDGKPGTELPIESEKTPVAKQDVGYGAVATGGLDDIEDIYSGKSGPGNDPFKEGGVKKRYIGGKRPSHMMFDSIADEEALVKLPRIDCPNCGIPVKGLNGGQEAYPVPSGQIDLSSGSPLIEQIPVLTYTLAPCGCRVNQEWASAFTVELNNRKAGKPPNVVVDMSLEARAKKQKQLQENIAKLYSARDAAATPGEKQAIEYSLVIMTDQLMRLTPGAHNQVQPVTLSSEVQKWAEKNKLKCPPSTAEPAPHGLPPKKLAVDLADGTSFTTTLMMQSYVPGDPITANKNNDYFCNLGSMKNPCGEIMLTPTPYTQPADKIAQVKAAADKAKAAALLAALTDAQRADLLSICAELNITPLEAIAKSKEYATNKALGDQYGKPPETVKPPEKFVVPPWIKNGLAEKLIDKNEMSDDMLAFLFGGISKTVPDTRTLPKPRPAHEDPVKIAQAAAKVAAMLDTYDKIRAQVAFLLPLLQKNRAYLTQLTRTCVVPGKLFSEAEQVVDAIGKNLQDFIDEKAPLSEHSSLLLTSFLLHSDFTPKAPSDYITTTAVGGVVAAPMSESLKEAMSAQAHKKAIEAKKETAREVFHAKLERRPRKILVPKPPEGGD